MVQQENNGDCLAEALLGCRRQESSLFVLQCMHRIVKWKEEVYGMICEELKLRMRPFRMLWAIVTSLIWSLHEYYLHGGTSGMRIL
ncbi:hypothetical protein DY000_02039423 [Brassica cretica]|uniref:Uncharacterized protein n=1 Tax=Brassica cretica TaxID=69181 RepID=A0ABQ7BKX9_BRACR|nr:hypothetical protein DY000_02039423 [Brassica cretica]